MSQDEDLPPLEMFAHRKHVLSAPDSPEDTEDYPDLTCSCGGLTVSWAASLAEAMAAFMAHARPGLFGPQPPQRQLPETSQA